MTTLPVQAFYRADWQGRSSPRFRSVHRERIAPRCPVPEPKRMRPRTGVKMTLGFCHRPSPWSRDSRRKARIPEVSTDSTTTMRASHIAPITSVVASPETQTTWSWRPGKERYSGKLRAPSRAGYISEGLLGVFRPFGKMQSRYASVAL